MHGTLAMREVERGRDALVLSIVPSRHFLSDGGSDYAYKNVAFQSSFELAAMLEAFDTPIEKNRLSLI